MSIDAKVVTNLTIDIKRKDALSDEEVMVSKRWTGEER